jgi:hypothetical protein
VPSAAAPTDTNNSERLVVTIDMMLISGICRNRP